MTDLSLVTKENIKHYEVITDQTLTAEAIVFLDDEENELATVGAGIDNYAPQGEEPFSSHFAIMYAYSPENQKESQIEVSANNDTGADLNSYIALTTDRAFYNQFDISTFIISDSAPTTATAGNIGTLCKYNSSLYACTAIDDTDPDNKVYTWAQVGGGGGNSDLTLPITIWDLTSTSTPAQIKTALGGDANTSEMISRCFSSKTFKILASGGPNGREVMETLTTFYNVVSGINVIGFSVYEPHYDYATLSVSEVHIRTFLFTVDASHNIQSFIKCYDKRLDTVIVQATGNSTTSIMSQNAVTTALNSRIISGGTTAPTTATVGAVGQLYTYYDTTNSVPVVMMCTAVSGSTYTWTDILGSVANQLAQL